MPQVALEPYPRTAAVAGRRPVVSQRTHRSREETGRRKFEFRLMLAYCSIFYLLPFILFQFFGNPLEFSFRPRPSYLLGILYVVASVAIFRLIQNLPRMRFRVVPYGISSIFFGRYCSLLISFLFLLISIWSFINLGFQFRQKGDALTDVGFLGFMLVLGKILMGTSIIVHYRLIKEGADTFIRSLCLLFISFGFTINIQGSFDVLIAFCAYVAATHRIRRSFHLTGNLFQNLSFVFLPFIIALLFFAGKANKVGVDEALHIVSNLDLFIISFLERYSYPLYSVSTHVSENFFNFGLAWDAIREVTSVMYFRLGSLIGLSVERPELGSIARMNFFVLADFYKDRIGTSPSMLGSVFFFPGAGLAIFYYVLLLRFIFSLFWRIMGTKMDNWLFIILSVILLSTAVDALLDAVNPLSNGFMRILTLYLGASFVVATLGAGRTAPKLSARRRLVPS